MKRSRIILTLLTAALMLFAAALFSHSQSVVAEDEHEGHDPAHNVALPCEALSTPGLAPRSARNIVHVANVCGFVGTDMEFQSRTDADGVVHDYAFVGTMGAGTRIFDVTDPAHPVQVGGYFDPGWQNDVHVRGDILVLGFDPVVVGVHVSTCLGDKAAAQGTVRKGGVDVVRLHFNPETATFETSLIGCHLSDISNGGAHTTMIHPSGEYLTINSSGEHIEIVDIRGPEPVHAKFLPNELVGSSHDVSFSRDGNTMYVASPDSGTYIIDVTNVLEQDAQQIAFIPENTEPGGSSNRYNLTTAHQSDVSADGQILVYTDERGGGLGQTACNTDSEGIIGGAHFWALAPVENQPQTADASPANPVRLGTWFYPNPTLALDVLDPVLESIGRTERSCTIHVFRNGGNGSAGPGEIAPGFDGVSGLPVNELVSAHYGAGVWHIDFSGPSTDTDGTAEDQYSEWGNTLGWNVMPGADTWSAKEYKGNIYAGDMARGFDVYRIADCEGLECIGSKTSSAGSASGGGVSDNAEFLIVDGTNIGGRATFSFSASFNAGDVVPTGSLTFIDHDLKKKVEATEIDSFNVVGNKATFTGRATVETKDQTTITTFTVVVEDNGEPGRDVDTFHIVLGDGYGAGGTITKGNIEVE